MKLLKKYPLSYYVIAINVVLYFGLAYLTNDLTNEYTKYVVLSAESFNEPISIILSYFMHGDLFHLMMNMIGLYFIGKGFENIYYKNEHIALYFFSGIVVSLVCYLYLYLVDSSASAVGYSGVLFLLLGTLFRHLDGKQLRNNCLFLLGYHIVAIFILNIPIFWEGHLAGLLLGIWYSYSRFLHTKYRCKAISTDDFDDMFNSDNRKNKKK